MEKAYRLGEVKNPCGKWNSLRKCDDIMESDEDYQIVISGWQVHIPELGPEPA